MKFGIRSLAFLSVAVIGVLIYLLAVTGNLFMARSPATDIGLYSVTVILVAFGVIGAFAAAAESRKQA